jgi:N-carbamoyl-L-amino-acid hydrolase
LDRRTFHRVLLAVLAAPRGLRASPRVQRPLRVDAERLNRRLDELSAFGRNALGGVTRVAYSEADREARAWVMAQMRSAGLETAIDAAGNLIGRRAGTEDLPPIGAGSHIDSVPEGGRYDGPVGAMAAIEVANTLADHGVRMRHPLEIVIFQNEENGKVGSRALRGEDPARYLDLGTHSGKTIREGIRFIGGDPARLSEVVRASGSMAAFVELHIEQGAVLEAADAQIGIVEGIVGIKRWNVTVEGFANHAGTTPMDQRQDALLAAARLIDAVNTVVRTTPGRHVGTVGVIRAEPGAPNVIPGRATLTIELRDVEMERIDALFAEIERRARAIGQDTGTRFAFEEIYRTLPARCNETVRGVIATAAGRLGLRTLSLPSGAGHDAQEMARFTPIGMIFVPSVRGISHSHEEFSTPEAIARGADVLLNTILQLDTLSIRAPG